MEWKIEKGLIANFRAVLNDGSALELDPMKKLDKSVELFENRPIRTVRVRHSNCRVYSLQFLDEENKVIVGITGKDKGYWTKIELEEGEEIIGFHAGYNNL